MAAGGGSDRPVHISDRVMHTIEPVMTWEQPHIHRLGDGSTPP